MFPEAKAGRRRGYHAPDAVAASAEMLTRLFVARRVRAADGHKHRASGGRV
jgi:hypothetical protein